MKRLLALLFLILLYPLVSLAHGGGTDGKGGHYDRSTGQYHYHHGYSAHQHPNGVCPYDFKDNTKPRSNSTKSYSRATATPAPTTPPKSTSEDNDITVEFLASSGAGYAIIHVLKNLRKKS